MNLLEKLKCLEGHPVKIYTDDRRIYRGIELDVNKDTVEIIDKSGRLFAISLCHIDAVEEPQLELRRFSPCSCDKGADAFDSDEYYDGEYYGGEYDYQNDKDRDCCGGSRCCKGCNCDD